MTFRDTASFGKRQEYRVIAELLGRGFDVYMTLVDDKAIDCIIRLSAKAYLDIQIKARSNTAKQWTTFSAMEVNVRRNFFYIFYTERNNSFWTMPSRDVKRLANKIKSGVNTGLCALRMPKQLKGEKYQRYARYHAEAGFKLLRRG